MARKLRIQYEGALYHVINRGNYRRDLFETAGAAKVFEELLWKGCEMHRWRVHAHVVMRNHFHLALETPEANLVEGMHWLLGTFATRFNRFREERGHLFQGRYQAILVEDAATLGRVVDYIHLNPVRAGVLPVEMVAKFRWSSLRRFVGNGRPPCLDPTGCLDAMRLEDSPQGWQEYIERLQALGVSPSQQERAGFDGMSRGWAIGTVGWRKALAETYAQLALNPGLEQAELRDLKESQWSEALEIALRQCSRTLDELNSTEKPAPWKIEIACALRGAGVPYSWIARQLHVPNPNALRMQVHRARTRQL
jgi:putative transposase